jgi:hypothetical protein
MIPPLTASFSWTERYETLRHHVVDGTRVLESKPLGLVLWLAQGMAGWMREWNKTVEVPPSPQGVLPPVRFAASATWQHQLTLLLAQFTVQRLYPAPGL